MLANNSLSFLSKKVLYSKSFLENLGLVSFSKSSNLSVTFNSLLKSNFSLFRVARIKRAWVTIVTSSFLCFSTNEKFSLLKPRFKTFFPSFLRSLISKEVLFSLRDFLDCLNVWHLLLVYRLVSLRKDSFVLKFMYIFSNCFFSFKLLVFLISSLQKKLSFLQFNIFFKKYKYICSKSVSNASVR